MTRFLGATACAAVALALIAAPTANGASDAVFLQQLTDAGLTWAGGDRPSDVELIFEAHAVCSWKGSGITYASAAQVQLDLDLNETQADRFISIAENAYCWG